MQDAVVGSVVGEVEDSLELHVVGLVAEMGKQH